MNDELSLGYSYDLEVAQSLYTYTFEDTGG